VNVKVELDPLGEAGLNFFGRMCASISHELKNALAIIRENAGLLNDYTEMIAKGMPIDTQRFKTVAARIDGQTRRANDIIKNLNQFAHTVDNPCRSVDLNEMVTLLVALCHRTASMRQVTLVPRPADTPVPVTTAPFVLLNALGLCLMFALQAVPPGGEMALTTERSENSASVCFGQLTSLADCSLGDFPAEAEGCLLKALGATVTKEPGAGRILIGFPAGNTVA
jgi:C4-dicarboxylate-specific signal transduction histidine kinase